MISFIVLACFVAVNGILYEPHMPKPYSFGYTIKDKEGVQGRHEIGNGAGVVEGNYGFTDNKGLHRQVNYIADHAGFRAAINTNEPGTAGQNPAAVLMMSNDPYAHGAAVPYVSRVNDPVVPSLYESNGVHGFPTIYGHKAYGPAPYAPAYGPAPYVPAYGQGHGASVQHRQPVAPLVGKELAAHMQFRRPVAPLVGKELAAHMQLRRPVAPLVGKRLVVPHHEGYLYGKAPINDYGQGPVHSTNYGGGLAHSNL